MSLAPVRCLERVLGLGFEDREAVGYCAALAWPLVSPSTPGSTACIGAGRDQTLLSDAEVIRLCRGAVSAAPVRCFEHGTAVTPLDDRWLVRLCAPVAVSAPRRSLPLRRAD